MNKEEYIKRVNIFCEKHGLTTSDFYVGHEDGLLLVGAIDKVDFIKLNIVNKKKFKEIRESREHPRIKISLENHYWDETNRIKIDRSYRHQEYHVVDKDTGVFRSSNKYLYHIEYILSLQREQLTEESHLVLLKTLINNQNKGRNLCKIESILSKK